MRDRFVRVRKSGRERERERERERDRERERERERVREREGDVKGFIRIYYDECVSRYI